MVPNLLPNQNRNKQANNPRFQIEYLQLNIIWVIFVFVSSETGIVLLKLHNHKKNKRNQKLNVFRSISKTSFFPKKCSS